MTLTDLTFSVFQSALFSAPLGENEKKALENENTVKMLLYVCNQHTMAHLLYDVFVENGIPTTETTKKRLQQQRDSAIFLCEQFQYELEEISALFEREKIDFIPLKGSVLRQHYPQRWHRTSGDLDILIKKEDRARADALLEKELSYTAKDVGEGAVTHFYTPTGLLIELHDDIQEFEDDGAFCQEVWNSAIRKTKRHLCMTDEAFYLHHLVHMKKHLLEGGCGIRFFLDLWFLQNIPHDKTKRAEGLKKHRLSKMNEGVVALAKVWFGGKTHTEETKRLEKYVLKSGTFGTEENKVSSIQVRNPWKFKDILKMIFLPYDQLRHVFPVLKKHKYLYPVLTVWRWIYLPFRGMSSKSKKHIKEIFKPNEEKQNEVKKLFTDLELL